MQKARQHLVRGSGRGKNHWSLTTTDRNIKRRPLVKSIRGILMRGESKRSEPGGDKAEDAYYVKGAKETRLTAGLKLSLKN